MRRKLRHGFAVVQGRLATALERQGLKVVAQLPTTEILARAGYAVPGVHQIFFFRPEFMNEIILLDQRNITEEPENAIMRAPLKAVIVEDGVESRIEIQDPVDIFRNHPSLAHLAADMGERIVRALDEFNAVRTQAKAGQRSSE